MSSSNRLFSTAATPLRFATRNCQSIASNIKLEQLGLDFKSYGIDFLALQETKRDIKQPTIKVPHTDSVLYTLKGGLGFVLGKRLQPYLQTSCSVSDRVAIVSFRFGKPEPSISVIIAYGPTSPRCQSNPQLREDFYQQLQAAVDVIPKRDVTILMGDMNAKIGKRCSTDIYSCMGILWSKGKRNDNGEAFLDFCE